MSIQSSELVWRRCTENSDLPTNGGRATSVAIASNVKNNVFPDLSQSERTAGLTRYRKAALHVASSQNLRLMNPSIFVETFTPGGDSVVFFPGTATDTQSSIAGTERTYGAGNLDADVSIGASSLTVMTEGASLNYFRDGDWIRISSKAAVDAVSGVTEYQQISGAPSYSGDVATITVAGTLNSGFSAVDTRVSSVYRPANIEATVDSATVTSASGGAFSAGTVLSAIGTIEDTWTLTFTSPTAFTISGAFAGAKGTGTTTSATAPSNTAYSKPYFTISAAQFSGTFTAGDTIVFTTHPAMVHLWYKQVVPPNTSSISGNYFILGIEGESE